MSGEGEPPIVAAVAQRRHLAISIRHIAGLLDEVERVVVASGTGSDHETYTNHLTTREAAELAEQIGVVRRKLREATGRIGVDVPVRNVDVRHAIRVQATVAAIDAREMHSQYLRAYGSLEEEAARRVDAIADALEDAILEIGRVVGGNARE